MTTLKDQVGGNLYRIGSSGFVVANIQIALRAVGYPLTGTGYFANATDTAVRAFQRRAGMKADGVVGAATAEALDLSLGGSAGARVVAIPAGEVGRPIWLEAALALVGIKEFAGGKDNPAIIDWAKDEGSSIAKAYTHDSIPWCALFANHVLTKSGLPGTETLWAMDFAGNWPAKKLAGSAVGAFAPMLRNGGGHITIIVGRDQHGNYMGVGGNQSDAVTVAPFAQSRLNQGFWWPESVSAPTAIGFSKLPLVTSNGRVSAAEA